MAHRDAGLRDDDVALGNAGLAARRSARAGVRRRVDGRRGGYGERGRCGGLRLARRRRQGAWRPGNPRPDGVLRFSRRRRRRTGFAVPGALWNGPTLLTAHRCRWLGNHSAEPLGMRREHAVVGEKRMPGWGHQRRKTGEQLDRRQHPVSAAAPSVLDAVRNAMATAWTKARSGSTAGARRAASPTLTATAARSTICVASSTARARRLTGIATGWVVEGVSAGLVWSEDACAGCAGSG